MQPCPLNGAHSNSGLPHHYRVRTQRRLPMSGIFLIFIIAFLCIFVLCAKEPSMGMPTDEELLPLRGRHIMIAANYYNSMGILEAHTEEVE
jgi:hypothetical protein